MSSRKPAAVIHNLDIQKKKLEVEQLQLFNHVLSTRAMVIQKLFGDTTKKDIDKECDFPPPPFKPEFYRALYNYTGIATRVVDVYPKETWKAVPLIQENERERVTPFETEVARLLMDPKICLLDSWKRADCLSGVASYGGLVATMVREDGEMESLETPAFEYDKYGDWVRSPFKRRLLSLRPFDQWSCQIVEVEKDKGSPRYGMPVMYELKIIPTDVQESLTFDTNMQNVQIVRVHATRVIHIPSDILQDSTICGVSRLQNVIPHIWNVRKISGGNGEMFYQGAFPGLSIEALPELFSQGLNPKLDEESMKEQVERYSLGMQRYISLIGAKANSLAPNVKDPGPHLDAELRMIAGIIDVPLKILLGSESGHLASQEDRKKWNESGASRREDFAGPRIVRTTIDQLCACGVLREPRVRGKYNVQWITRFNALDPERATIVLKYAQAFSQYANSTAPKMFGPLSFLTECLGMPLEKAIEGLREGQKDGKKVMAPEQTMKGAVGNTKGRSNSTGRPKGNPGS